MPEDFDAKLAGGGCAATDNLGDPEVHLDAHQLVIRGPLWERMLAAPRRPAATIKGLDVPEAPGVYAWFRDGEPVYAGRALGSRGLHDRVWRNHLDQGRDLSRSSYRRNVCDHLGIAPTTVTRRRPPELSHDQVAVISSWIRMCEVAWLTFDRAEAAKAFEKALLREWMPPLSRR